MVPKIAPCSAPTPTHGKQSFPDPQGAVASQVPVGPFGSRPQGWIALYPDCVLGPPRHQWMGAEEHDDSLVEYPQPLVVTCGKAIQNS